jgi:hypothetical protein
LSRFLVQLHGMRESGSLSETQTLGSRRSGQI